MAKKYDHLSREDLIALHQKRDASRKLGLVWERDEIEHEATLNDDLVVLDLDESLSVGRGPHRNLIIEGDNFDALRYLNIAYKGRVKCIYIDPPYNTGNKDFVYNDHYVDKEDRFRHSTWLEFMYRRLVLAKELLRNDGVLLVSINDENRSRLELLMEQVLPGMRKGSLVWRTKDTGNDSGPRLSQVHEHILIFARPGFKFTGRPADRSKFRNPDNDSRGEWAPRPLTKAHDYTVRDNTYYPIQDPSTGYWYPCDPNRVWAYASEAKPSKKKKLQSETMEEFIRQGKIYFPPCKPSQVMRFETREALDIAIANGKGPVLPKKKTPLFNDKLPDLDFWADGKPIAPGRPSMKDYWKDKPEGERVAPLGSWITGMNEDFADDEDNEDAPLALASPRGGVATEEVKQILGAKVFDFPKPLQLIKNLVQQSTGKGDIVLDFFAGSGTTGQAVEELNREDGAARLFIMVSNTEATRDEPEKNVCRDITARRIGNTGGAFAYLRTRRIAMERLHSSIQHSQVWIALQQLHAGVVTPYAKGDLHLLDIADTDLYYVSKVSKTVIDTLIQRTRKKKPAVVFSWQPGLLTQRIASEHIAFGKIPEFLVDRFGGQK